MGVSLFSKNHHITDLEFKEIFEHYSGNLYLYALNFLKTEAEAEDVVQEVFIRFWKNVNTELENEKVIKTYLFNSVRNACLNLLEKKTPVYLKTEELKQEITEENAIRFNDQLFEEIQQELHRLPPQTQKIIVMIFLSNRKYQEVADELEVSVNTVKTLLRNGIKKLRNHFANRSDLWLAIIIFNKSVLLNTQRCKTE